MQTDKTLFNDAARAAAGAIGAVGDVRQQIESMFRERVERLLAKMDLPTREEVEAAKAMAAAARDENELLAARVARLEAPPSTAPAPEEAPPRRRAASGTRTRAGAKPTAKSGARSKPAKPSE